MEHHSIIVVDDGYFNIGGYLLLENGTIIGNVQVAAQVTATIIGAKVGVTGTVVIDEGATVTISGSEKAVGSSITYDGTLYGSADENGAAGDTVEFRDGTCYVGDAVAKRISTEKETPANHSGEAGTAGKSYCGLPRQVFFQASPWALRLTALWMRTIRR